MQIQSGACCVCLVTYRESTIWIHLCSTDTRGTAEHSQTLKRSHHMHTLSSGSEHTHTHCFGAQQETRDLYSRQLLTSVFLRSPGSGHSELCHRTDNATAYPAFPDPCPSVMGHHPFFYPSCVHHPPLHRWTSWAGETSFKISSDRVYRM